MRSPVGLYCLSNTAAEIVYEDIRMFFSNVVFIFHCAEGKYMMGHQICKEYELVLLPCTIQAETLAALPVHSLAHLLNLCIQDTGKQFQILRDTLDIV